ncbi:MAG TPA: ATP-dependent RecD-like DNA helicase [Polyangiaceae bacterium]|nr:ATP-dependent RecD-like DNA helicase [Polyangiaceae bacterium]
MPTLAGEVQRVTFENEETSFRVVRVLENPKSEPIVVVGVFTAVGPGNQIRATGTFIDDPKHGRQFRVDSLMVVAPETLDGIERYLGSGAIPGLGPVFAKRIVETFGTSTLHVLDRDPRQLAKVPGLKGKRLDTIARGWADQRELSNVRLILQKHGAGIGLANRILERYGDRAATMLESHPYRLALDVVGIGFKTADRLAQSLGLSRDHPERVQAGVLHVLEKLADSGHVRVPRSELTGECERLLEVDGGHAQAATDALWAAGRVVVTGSDVYLTHLEHAEREVARHLVRLLRAPGRELSGWERAIAAFEKSAGYALSPEQRQSVERVAREKVLVITGGPGVGKTTIVRAILQVLQASRLDVRLAAPTGRAAKRLSESTRQHAVTIHRLLEYDPHLHAFARKPESPLEAHAFVIDEASMVDIELARALLAALPDAGRLILVGDVDQLPSVGPGAFLHDVIESQVVPTVRLNRIFRQSEASSIVKSAHAILEGEEPQSDPPDAERPEFFVIPKRTPEDAAATIEKLVLERIPQRFGLDARRDIQVLTPMHRGAAGTLALNQMLQHAINPHQPGLEHKQEKLCIGDKVMQIRNDYEKEAFNGDLGRVVELDIKSARAAVDFDGRIVRYVGNEIDALRLAYATSIHKSQGSEYPAVVIPLSTSHFPMLSRNLLYTAVTRAKRLCVLVADPRALRVALDEQRKERRGTGLEERLRKAVEEASRI